MLLELNSHLASLLLPLLNVTPPHILDHCAVHLPKLWLIREEGLGENSERAIIDEHEVVEEEPVPTQLFRLVDVPHNLELAHIGMQVLIHKAEVKAEPIVSEDVVLHTCLVEGASPIHIQIIRVVLDVAVTIIHEEVYQQPQALLRFSSHKHLVHSLIESRCLPTLYLARFLVMVVTRLDSLQVAHQANTVGNHVIVGAALLVVVSVRLYINGSSPDLIELLQSLLCEVEYWRFLSGFLH
jgi:hypothetical protein